MRSSRVSAFSAAIIGLLIATGGYCQTVTIASWNVRIYSTGSRDDAELELICDRLEQFDLVAVQELRDQEVIDRTLAILQGRGQDFEALVSEGVGRGVLERYGFLWRPEKVELVDVGGFYPDPEDLLIREPYWATFRAGSFDFTLISTHNIWGDRVADRRAEAALMDDVYAYVQAVDPAEQDVILMGDFNLPPDDAGFEELRGVLTPLFNADQRTVISDNEIYDNVWVDLAFVAEWTGETGIDVFDEAVFDDDDRAASLAVSDHRPIWAKFRTGSDDDGPGASTGVAGSSWAEIKR